MRSRPAWLPFAAYVVVAALGAGWAEHARGSVLSAPGSLAREDGSWRALLGLLVALAVARLTVRATRVLVARTQWARQLHGELRAALLGTSSARMALQAGLAALSEELFLRAALGPAIGFVASSAAFGCAHLSSRDGQVPWALWAGAMGLLFSALYLLSGSLLAPILAHWLINYENMQYICRYDPTSLHTENTAPRSRYKSNR
jgi:membrane protease YdiL (CAAX protease family)